MTGSRIRGKCYIEGTSELVKAYTFYLLYFEYKVMLAYLKRQ